MAEQIKKRESNVEFITRLMEFSDNGAIMQAFIIEAIHSYSQNVTLMTTKQQEKMNKSFITYDCWNRCAREVIEKVEKR